MKAFLGGNVSDPYVMRDAYPMRVASNPFCPASVDIFLYIFLVNYKNMLMKVVGEKGYPILYEWDIR